MSWDVFSSKDSSTRDFVNETSKFSWGNNTQVSDSGHVFSTGRYIPQTVAPRPTPAKQPSPILEQLKGIGRAVAPGIPPLQGLQAATGFLNPAGGLFKMNATSNGIGNIGTNLFGNMDMSTMMMLMMMMGGGRRGGMSNMLMMMMLMGGGGGLNLSTGMLGASDMGSQMMLGMLLPKMGMTTAMMLGGAGTALFNSMKPGARRRRYYRGRYGGSGAAYYKGLAAGRAGR